MIIGVDFYRKNTLLIKSFQTCPNVNHNKNNHNPDQTALDPVMGEPLFETKGIFTDHYLKRWLKESPLWSHDSGVKECFERVKVMVESAAGYIWNLNEAQFRNEFLDKILLELGYYSIPENITPATGKGTPDYLITFRTLTMNQHEDPILNGLS